MRIKELQVLLHYFMRSIVELLYLTVPNAVINISNYINIAYFHFKI